MITILVLCALAMYAATIITGIKRQTSAHIWLLTATVLITMALVLLGPHALPITAGTLTLIKATATITITGCTILHLGRLFQPPAEARP